jgi:hypothetical protein
MLEWRATLTARFKEHRWRLHNPSERLIINPQSGALQVR